MYKVLRFCIHMMMGVHELGLSNKIIWFRIPGVHSIWSKKDISSKSLPANTKVAMSMAQGHKVPKKGYIVHYGQMVG